MKKTFLLLLAMLAVLSSSAQDVIVKKDGSTILSKVLEVNPADIKYKKFNNPNGPIYTIDKSEIMSINYENGDKDIFTNDNANAALTNNNNTKQINKPADARNAEILGLHNRIYNLPTIYQKKNSLTSQYLLFLGVKASSIMSNDDLEMTFVKDNMRSPYSGNYTIYHIKLTNKTDRTIYIDKGNCFRLYNNGEFFCYFDNSEQTTVTLGGGSGASLGIGSVASAMGIGGTVGQLANGVSVGGGTSHSVSTTYSQQRIIAIPPHGTRNLTDEKWVKTKNENLLSVAEYDLVEEAECFNEARVLVHHNIPNPQFDLEDDLVNKGEVLIYKEDESPWKQEYIITYSFDETFSTYSSLNAELYLHEILGWYWKYNIKNMDGITSVQLKI